MEMVIEFSQIAGQFAFGRSSNQQADLYFGPERRLKRTLSENCRPNQNGEGGFNVD